MTQPIPSTSRTVLRRRLELALSVAELATAAGVGEDTVRRIERGEVEPQMRTLRRLADALGVPVVDLLAGVAR